LREALADLATHLLAQMRQSWSDTLALDRTRNAALLEAALPPAGPVTLVDDGGARVVWIPKDDGLDARLEHRAMSLLARRCAADPKLAAAWQDLAIAVHGDVRESDR
jgi:hypothetical protein